MLARKWTPKKAVTKKGAFKRASAAATDAEWHRLSEMLRQLRVDTDTLSARADRLLRRLS